MVTINDIEYSSNYKYYQSIEPKQKKQKHKNVIKQQPKID